MEWYWWLIIGVVVLSIPLKIKFMKWYGEYSKRKKDKEVNDE